jgi:hypothetical protein
MHQKEGRKMWEKWSFSTRRVDRGEEPVVEGTGLEVPDLVGVVEEPVAHELVLPRQQPDQVHLLGHEELEIQSHTIPLSHIRINHQYSNCRRCRAETKTHLVLLLEAEGSGEEGGGPGVRAHVGDAPRLGEG